MSLIFAAPLQGYTEGIWRNAHAEVFGTCGGVPDAYFSPFLRVEKGAARQRDFRDLEISRQSTHTVPQIIFRDVDEFRLLADSLGEAGYTEIDLNLGCPFPPQCHKGRGAAMIARSGILAEICEEMTRRPATRFSIKMRLGLSDPYEWRETAGIINAMPLSHVTIHPRVGRQQYRGNLDLDAYAALSVALVHPVIFNGNIADADDIRRILATFPSTAGIMAGRGLLSRPSLVAEWRSGEEWSRERRLESLGAMHSIIFSHYTSTLCGEAQMLAKLLPFWEYPAAIIGARNAKAIRKSPTLSVYSARVADALRG